MSNKRLSAQLFGEIDYETLEQLWPVLAEADEADADLDLYISSPGGDTGVGWAIYDALQAISGYVTTMAVGLVASTAVPVFLAGDHRLCTPNTLFYLHSGSAVLVEGEHTHAEIVTEAQSLKLDLDHYVAVIAERTGLSRRRVKAMCLRTTEFMPRPAQRLGFIHGVHETGTGLYRKKGQS